MASTSGNPALNTVLSEVIDVVQDVKQAHRRVPASHVLHAELELLFADLRAWAQLLLEQEEALGLSPLDAMPSVAGRRPPNLWPGPVTDEDVRMLVDEHLGRLAGHVTAAMAAQDDDGARAALAEVEHGLLDHRRKLSASGS